MYVSLIQSCVIRTIYCVSQTMSGSGAISALQKSDVPLLNVSFIISFALSAQRSAHYFKTPYGATFPHTAHLHNLAKHHQYKYHTTADNPTNNGRGEQRSPAFVRIHGLYNFKPRHSPKRDVEGAVPYNSALLCYAAKSLRSLRILRRAGG